LHSLDDKTSLHGPAFDLWETFRGSFTYSNAAISAALIEGAHLARLAGRGGLAEEYERGASSIKEAVMSRLWLGDRFARGLDPAGHLDTAADASALGLIVPFELLDVDDPNEREIARACVEGLVRRLGVKIGDAEALRRFDGDGYAGGGPGALTTIWLARVFLRLSLACRQDLEVALAYRTRAIATMRAVLASGTQTGLLPEMMGAQPGARWAVPHAWTMCNFVLACLMLDESPPIPETSGGA
jgi:GH15 family glucan-1,4-alpha-glucosidase